MKIVIEAATDSASLVLFDPSALPVDFDHKFLADAGTTLEEMENRGLACWIQTGRDGYFLLHVYLNEPVPRELAELVDEQTTIEGFLIPSGQIVFAGAEGAYREDDNFLRDHPQMGGTARIPPGRYHLRVHRVRVPRGVIDERFNHESSPWEYRAWASMKVLIPLAVAAWIGLVVYFFTRVRVPLPSVLAPVLMVLFAMPFLIRMLEPYRNAKKRYAGVEREYPSIVAQLYLVDTLPQCHSSLSESRM